MQGHHGLHWVSCLHATYMQGHGLHSSLVGIHACIHTWANERVVCGLQALNPACDGCLGNANQAANQANFALPSTACGMSCIHAWTRRRMEARGARQHWSACSPGGVNLRLCCWLVCLAASSGSCRLERGGVDALVVTQVLWGRGPGQHAAGGAAPAPCNCKPTLGFCASV